MSKLFSYKRYKKIYPNTNIYKYVWRHLLFTPRRWCRIPYCTYMCLKYPFLYRRNRFTGLHYNNWALINKRDKLNQKYHKHIFDKDGIDMDDFANQLKINDKWYIRVTSEKSLDYWENWWAKPLYCIIDFIHNYILQIIFCLPTSIEWDAMEDGWKKAFGKQYLKDLKKQLKKDKMLYSWRITDIKEKYGCYDDQTEVLTKDGWKFFKDVSMSDEFATIDENDHLIYQSPTDIINYKYSGDMYRLENRGISLKVTPNHNLYIAKGSYFYGKKDNLKVTFPFEFCSPEKYFGRDKRFKKGCFWNGNTPEEYFKIPDYKYSHSYKDKRGYNVSREYYKTGPNIEIVAFLKFLGFYVAEGYTYIRNQKNCATISISFNPYDETNLVKELITNIGFRPHIYNGQATFTNTPLGHWLKCNCGHKAPNKKVPNFIKNLDSESIKLFLTYLFIGDGYKSKTSWTLTTTSKQLKDDVCELILKCGGSFAVHERLPRPSMNNVLRRMINSTLISYEINWLKSTEIEIDNSKTKKTLSFIEQWEPYVGQVYCVTIPNHVLYIRRNGKGVWCGNSLRLYCNKASKELYNIINYYEDLSWNTCIKCGKPATYTSKGWIAPYCEECVNKDNNKNNYIKRNNNETK